MAAHIGNCNPILATNRLLYLEVPFLIFRSTKLSREPSNVWLRSSGREQLLDRQAVGEGGDSERGVPVANCICGVAHSSRSAGWITPSHGATSDVWTEQIYPHQIRDIHERVGDKRREGIIENSDAAAHHRLAVVSRRPGKTKARSEVDAI